MGSRSWPSWLGFNFGDWLPLMSAMIATGFLGTWMGTRLLERMPEALFKTVLKWLLTILSLDLCGGRGF